MQAVRYIHSIGVAHRDIKLENILLRKDGKTIKVKDLSPSFSISDNALSLQHRNTVNLSMTLYQSYASKRTAGLPGIVGRNA